MVVTRDDVTVEKSVDWVSRRVSRYFWRCLFRVYSKREWEGTTSERKNIVTALCCGGQARARLAIAALVTIKDWLLQVLLPGWEYIVFNGKYVHSMEGKKATHCELFWLLEVWCFRGTDRKEWIAAWHPFFSLNRRAIRSAFIHPRADLWGSFHLEMDPLLAPTHTSSLLSLKGSHTLAHPSSMPSQGWRNPLLKSYGNSWLFGFLPSCHLCHSHCFTSGSCQWVALLLLHSFAPKTKQKIFTHLRSSRAQLLFTGLSNANAEPRGRAGSAGSVRKKSENTWLMCESTFLFLLNRLLNCVDWGNLHPHIERDLFFLLILEIG